MKIILAILASIALVGCGDSPKAQSSALSSNSQFTVETLFTHEGVTVYRFYDGSRNVYYTNRVGVVSTTHSEKSGKNNVEIPTQVESR